MNGCLLRSRTLFQTISNNIKLPPHTLARCFSTASYSRPATSNSRPATSNPRPATSNSRPATSNSRPADTISLHQWFRNHQQTPGVAVDVIFADEWAAFQKNVSESPQFLIPLSNSSGTSRRGFFFLFVHFQNSYAFLTPLNAFQDTFEPNLEQQQQQQRSNSKMNVDSYSPSSPASGMSGGSGVGMFSRSTSSRHLSASVDTNSNTNSTGISRPPVAVLSLQRQQTEDGPVGLVRCDSVSNLKLTKTDLIFCVDYIRAFYGDSTLYKECVLRFNHDTRDFDFAQFMLKTQPVRNQLLQGARFVVMEGIGGTTEAIFE